MALRGTGVITRSLVATTMRLLGVARDLGLST